MFSLSPQMRPSRRNSDAAATGEYRASVLNNEGYFRFNVAHFGRNPNYQFLSEAGSHTLVDLFAGIRDKDSEWDVQAFVKNAFNVKQKLQELPIANLPPPSQVFGPAGYTQINATRPREIGVQLRYAFGSR